MKTLFKLCCVMLLSAACFGQSSPTQPGGQKTCPQKWDGTVTTSAVQMSLANDCGSVRATFEEIITGGPVSMSAVIVGCMRGNSTCTSLDTYTGTTSSQRKPVLDTVYDYFLVTPTWSGGTNVTFTVHATLTTAGGAGSGTTLTASSPITITAGVVGCPSCGTGTGNVAGAASSTDNDVALFSGTTGKLLKDGTPMPAAFSAPAHQFVTSYTPSTGAFGSSALVSGDIPNNAANTSGTAANVSGTPTLPSGTTLPGYAIAQTCTDTLLAAVDNAGTAGNCVHPALNGAVFANQGTTTTVFHGNAAGNGSFGSVVNGDIAAATIDLTAKVTGALPVTNGGSGNVTATAHAVQIGEGTSPTVYVGGGALSGQTLTFNHGADPSANSPSLLTTIVSATSDAVACDSGTATVDRSTIKSYTSSSATAVSIPSVAAAGCGAGFSFGLMASGSGGVTVTPTTSTITYCSGFSCTPGASTLSMPQGSFCSFSSDAGNNYEARCVGIVLPGLTLAQTPLTTPGDTLYVDGTSSLNRLAIGTEGFFEFVQSGLPAWNGHLSDLSSILAYTGSGGIQASQISTVGANAGLIYWVPDVSNSGNAVAGAWNEMADTSITGTPIKKKPTAAYTGFDYVVNSSGTMTPSNGELSGDCSTTGSRVVTCASLNGVTFPSSAAADTVPTATASNTVAYKALANCLDSSGQHLNYSTSTHSWICGTSASAPAAVVNSTAVTVSANTTSDQALMEVALATGALNTAVTPYLLHGSGILTIGTAQTPTLTYKVKLCTVSGCGSGTVVSLASITTAATIAATNNNWNIQIAAATKTTGASGTLIVHGAPGLTVDISAGAATADAVYGDQNTGVSSTIDLTAALFVDFTVSTSAGSTLNSFTQQLGFYAPQGLVSGNFVSVSGSTTVGHPAAFDNSAPAKLIDQRLIGTSIPSSDTVTQAGCPTPPCAFATTRTPSSTGLAVGSLIEYHFKGRYTTTATSTPLMNLRLDAGGTTSLCPAISTAFTINVSTTAVWWADCYVQIITTGNPGTAMVWGTWNVATSGSGSPTTKNWLQSGTANYITTSDQTATIYETGTMVSGQSFQLDVSYTKVSY